MTTRVTERRVADNDAATIEESIDASLDAGVTFQARQTTIDPMDYGEDDSYDGVAAGVGAATAIRDRPTPTFDSDPISRSHRQRNT